MKLGKVTDFCFYPEESQRLSIIAIICLEVGLVFYLLSYFIS